MKTVNLPITSGKLEFLQKSKIPFNVSFTNNSTTIDLVNEKIRYFLAPDFLKKSELNFIGRVKKTAVNCGKPEIGISANNIQYFRFNNFKQIKNLIEIDVNSAYWQLAHQLGYVDDKLFQEGVNSEKISKMARLVALGSLATKKKVFQFDGSNFHYIGYKFNSVTRSYFFHVSYELDKIMNEIFSEIGEKALFYWFDAFFVSADVAEFIEYSLGRFDLGIKTKQIHEITRKKDQQGFEYIKVRDEKKIRTFYLPNVDRQLKIVSEYQV